MRYPFIFSSTCSAVATLTLEEAIAHARYWGDKGEPWKYMRIDHKDGRSWTWEIKRGKPHLVEHT